MKNKGRALMVAAVAAVMVLIGFAAASGDGKKAVSQKSSEASVVTNDNGSVSRSYTESTVTTNGNMVTERRRETRTTLDADGSILESALEATASVAALVGAAGDAEGFRARAAKLRAEVVPRYWSSERGCLMHMIYRDGRVDPMVTRYPNMFGLFFGYFDEAQRESVVKNVIFNDDVLRIQTPYMRFYELEALCALGRQEDVLREIKSYWGGMLRLGATSFWELYNPDESGEAHYAMYGRRFGKSLCHAWGASPVYLLGKYFLGVTPTSPGFATYDVKPNLGGLEWIEGDVPTPWGRIHVRADRNGHKVTEVRD